MKFMTQQQSRLEIFYSDLWEIMLCVCVCVIDFHFFCVFISLIEKVAGKLG